MSINHYSSSDHHLLEIIPSPNNYLLHPSHVRRRVEEESFTTSSMEYSDEDEIPKTPLFEKPLTPSDVGKLNRLVIPKQHAENCFPMNAAAGDPKGCYLSFEDEAGKSWRFRYSYWNSSQSYVLTKGWSRFVKESHLGAGDIVVFSRHSEDAARFFIGWRRRRNSGCAGESGGGGWAHPPLSRLQASSSLSYQSDSPHAAAAAAAAGSDTLTHNQQRKATSGNSKKLRLFGVNLEYCEAEEDVDEEIILTPPMGQTPYPTITPTWT